MSRLRADITWKHRININSSIPTPFSIINDIEESNYINIEKNVEENVENIEENLEEENIESEEDEEEANTSELEKEFGNYLQGWAEMLEEETSKFENEEYEINEMDVSDVTTNDIIHAAIDPDAKWKLESLFKDLEFPF